MEVRLSPINSCNNRNRLYWRFLRNPSEANERLYKDCRNRLTSIIHLAKKNVYAIRFNKCKNNVKSTWREINNILGKGKRADLTDSCHDDQRVYSEPSDIANAFNSYFTLTLVTFTSWITYTTYNSSLFLILPDSFEIFEIGNKFSSDTSCGYDDIQSSVFKSVIFFISQPLAYIFNIPFRTGSESEDCQSHPCL